MDSPTKRLRTGTTGYVSTPEDSSLPGSPAATMDSSQESEDAPFDPSMAPEVGEMTQAFQGIVIDPVEQGDELQNKAISLVRQGQNLFLTGKAGTGKSWVTRQIVHLLSQDNRSIHVTAPTGIAAINVDGMTIHAYANFGLGEYYTDFQRMLEDKTRKKIRKTDTLVIDEISMLNGHLFDVLECMVSIIRYYDEVKDLVKAIQSNAKAIGLEAGGHSPQGQRASTMSKHMLDMRWQSENVGGLGDIPPWGGLQLVLVGDFFQLGPVPNRSDKVLLKNDEMWQQHYNLKVGTSSHYAFQSRAWSRSELHTVELTTVHRQSSDNGLLDFLNAMRVGEPELLYSHRETVNSLLAPLPLREDGIVPTELHATNQSVARRNQEELSKLPGKEYEYKAVDQVELDYHYKERVLRKHGMVEVAHMPYLWACVEPMLPPKRLEDAKMELAELERKKIELVVSEKYEELIAMRPQFEESRRDIAALEEQEAAHSIITVDTIRQWLSKQQDSAGEDPGSPSRKRSSSDLDTQAIALFSKIQGFQAQLKEDMAALEDHASKRFFEKNCRAASLVQLKKNAQVMLLRNLDLEKKLANGSRGIIVDLISVGDYKQLLKELFQLDNNSTNTQTPSDPNERQNGPREIPRGALHETETTDGRPTRDDSNSVTATSDSKSAPYTFTLEPGLLNKLRAELKEHFNPEQAQEDLQKLSKLVASGLQELPMIRFVSGLLHVIVPQPFRKEFKGCGTATRWQLPLVLAWSITIHKSQGMTIDWLRVNLQGCFSEGQAYVACSRGRGVGCMTIGNLSEHVVLTSQLVKKFYLNLDNPHPPPMPTWADGFEAAGQEDKLRMIMTRRYGGTACRGCQEPCDVHRVQTNTNGNLGKWYLACKHRGSFHTFQWLRVPSNVDVNDPW